MAWTVKVQLQLVKLDMDDGGSEKDAGTFSGTSETFAISDSGYVKMRLAESLIGVGDNRSGEDCDMLKMVVPTALLAMIASKVNACKSYAENKI